MSQEADVLIVSKSLLAAASPACCGICIPYGDCMSHILYPQCTLNSRFWKIKVSQNFWRDETRFLCPCVTAKIVLSMSHLATNNSRNLRTIHLTLARLLTDCHKSVNCLKGKSRRVQSQVCYLLVPRGLQNTYRFQFIRNAYSPLSSASVGTKYLHRKS